MSNNLNGKPNPLSKGTHLKVFLIIAASCLTLSCSDGGTKSPVTPEETFNLTCPTGYVKVPGNDTPGLGGPVYTKGTRSNYDWNDESSVAADRGTADFCVMKYEAKDGGSHIAVSVPEGLPWVFLKREDPADDDAQEACENNGDNYQLIGNHHWQAIARDIESVALNFDRSGAEADYSLNYGHANDAPGGDPLPADADDMNGCSGIVTNGDPEDDCGGVWHINKRTHSLSNGEVIWDISSNVAEWVRDNNSTSQGSDDFIQAAPYSDVLRWGPSEEYLAQSGQHKAGLGFARLGHFAGSVIRSNNWSGGANAGVFAVNLAGPPNIGYSGVGFRCVYAP